MVMLPYWNRKANASTIHAPENIAGPIGTIQNKQTQLEQLDHRVRPRRLWLVDEKYRAFSLTEAWSVI